MRRVLPHFLMDVDACDDDLAAGGQDFAKNDLKESGFPGAAGTGDEPEIPFQDMEVDVEQRPLSLLVLLRNVVKLNHYGWAQTACPVTGYSISNGGFLGTAGPEEGRLQRAKRYISQPKARALTTMIRHSESPYLSRLLGSSRRMRERTPETKKA